MNIKIFQKIVFIVIPIFIFIILFLGWLSSKKIREVVTENFNLQQLILARNAADLIKNDIDSLKNQLDEFSSIISNDQILNLSTIMKIHYIGIKDKGGVEVKYVDDKKFMYSHDEAGFKKIKVTFPDLEYFLKLTKVNKSSDDKYLTEIFIENYKGFNRPHFNIFKFIKKQSFKGGDKKTTKGVVIFKIDAYSLISKITKGIISGHTGYAYVIDQKNLFLYHYEKGFIGRNSIEVRKEKGPGIPFEKIDEIQSNYMLKGYEGTDWYISGWHRGVMGEMKKLIAYTPIYLSDSTNHLWSIAVVAPETEVEGAIRDLQMRLSIIQMVFIFGSMIFGLMHTFVLINWSDSLRHEVEKTTLGLRVSEERYRALVENADDIIFTLDSTGKYLSMNKYGLKFFNRKKEEVIGKHIEEIIPKPFVDVLSTMLIDVFMNKESIKFTHYIKIDENEYWLNTSMRRLYDAEGATYAVLGISRDITATKKKEMEEQMYHTEKLASMGTLAAGVAHEINNPLAIILGFTDLLLEQTTPNSNEYVMLKTIEKHALNAKKVVEGLLSFARYSEQKEDICDINENINVVLSVVQNSLILNNIHTKKELQSDLPRIKGDPGKFQQVFLNIINNAIHAMKGGGTLTIRTRSIDNESVEIRFSDTGHGIAPEHRSKIFDPLFTTKKVGEGTGLGLSVCYGIITQHGGKITFETKTKEESESPGTTFIITLPVAK
ncbi:MAG: ATP-binding protein [Thermodesulfovibrionales bacterium]|nr:ATP-binding protein [Thermodesulfovibrionales bacterium]